MGRNNRIQFAFIIITGLNLGLFSCKKDLEEPTTDVAHPATSNSSKYISRIFDYVPAPGQFINTGLGNMEATKSVIGQANQGLISLGAFGGFITFGFDHSVENIKGPDIGIFGNPLTAVGSEWSEPAIVMVMQDLNRNGLPDDGNWLELVGSEYTNGIKNYRITYYNPKNTRDDILWKDNQGKQGYVLRNMFYGQQYYPLWAKNQEELTLTGTLLKSTLLDGDVITNKPFSWGYADNGSDDYKLMQQDKGTAYNVFDISNAVDATGQKVALNYIDFVKVYTAQNSNGNPYEPDKNDARSRYLGEISAEFGGAIDLKLQQ